MANQIISFHVVNPNTEWINDKLIRENKYDKWFSNLIIHDDENDFYKYQLKNGQKKLNSFLLLYFENFAISYGTGLYNYKISDAEILNDFLNNYNKYTTVFNRGDNEIINYNKIQQEYNNVGLMISRRIMTDDWSDPANPILFRNISKGLKYLKNKVAWDDKIMKTSIYISQDNNIITSNLWDFLRDDNDLYTCYKVSLVPFK